MKLEKLEQWLALFPENKEVPSDGYHKGKVKDIVNKMQKFCKENKQYTEDIIFAATKMYIATRKAVNYAYIRRPHYFISKLGQPSTLEEFCDKILSGEQMKQPIELQNNTYQPANDFI